FASFKKEMAYRRDFKDIEDVREAVFRYIELFYNRKRLHSSLGYMTPVEYRLSKQAA
ncbi:MAG: IS3 family transposase, partial [Fibrobacteraceae bacterium]|nr:IS3 family transposase [Fibrobacteraceae bacterium]